MATAKQKSNVARVTKLRDDTAEAAIGKAVGEHVGEVLRKGREDRGMTLDMVADELMIRRFYLEALEAGSFRDLPERVYATGFVRSYATYVGLDVPVVVEQFRRDAYGSRSSAYQVELVMPEPVVHSVIPGRTVILSAICALALIIGGVIYVTRAKTDMTTTIPSPPEMTSDIASPEMVTDQLPEIVAPAATASPVTGSVTNGTTATGFDLPTTATAATTSITTPATTAPDNAVAGLPTPTSSAVLPDTAAAPAATTRLSVESLESSWVEVKDGKGKMMFTGILKKGQLLPIPDQKGITLTTGNAGGLRVLLDGQALAPLGQTNEVKRNLPLEPEKFTKR